jgi:hypothetical protein
MMVNPSTPQGSLTPASSSSSQRPMTAQRFTQLGNPNQPGVRARKVELHVPTNALPARQPSATVPLTADSSLHCDNDYDYDMPFDGMDGTDFGDGLYIGGDKDEGSSEIAESEDEVDLEKRTEKEALADVSVCSVLLLNFHNLH